MIPYSCIGLFERIPVQGVCCEIAAGPQSLPSPVLRLQSWRCIASKRLGSSTASLMLTFTGTSRENTSRTERCAVWCGRLGPSGPRKGWRMVLNDGVDLAPVGQYPFDQRGHEAVCFLVDVFVKTRRASTSSALCGCNRVRKKSGGRCFEPCVVKPCVMRAAPVDESADVLGPCDVDGLGVRTDSLDEPAENSTGAYFTVGGHTLSGHVLHRSLPLDTLPELRQQLVVEFLAGHQRLCGHVGDDGGARCLEIEALEHAAEFVQHRLHQRRVERTTDIQWNQASRTAFLRKLLGFLELVHRPADDQLSGALIFDISTPASLHTSIRGCGRMRSRHHAARSLQAASYMRRPRSRTSLMASVSGSTPQPREPYTHPGCGRPVRRFWQLGPQTWRAASRQAMLVARIAGCTLTVLSALRLALRNTTLRQRNRDWRPPRRTPRG